MDSEKTSVAEATQHHYFNGRSADGYRGKRNEPAGRKQYFCPICRITIAGHPTSITIHNQSDQHQQGMRQLVKTGKRDFDKTTAGYHFANFHRQKGLTNSSTADELKKIE